MLKNFHKLIASEDFKGISETELKEYISDTRLKVNEDPVFEAVVTWVKHDVENRKSSFDSLMENIKLSNCSPGFLRDTVRNELLMKTATCLELLANNALNCYASYYPLQQGWARGDNSGDNTHIAAYEDQCLTLRDGE